MKNKLVKRVPVVDELVYSPGYIAPSGTFYPGRLSVFAGEPIGGIPQHRPKLVVVGYQKDATQDEFRSVGERIRYILRVGLERLECEARDYVDSSGNWR